MRHANAQIALGLYTQGHYTAKEELRPRGGFILPEIDSFSPTSGEVGTQVQWASFLRSW